MSRAAIRGATAPGTPEAREPAIHELIPVPKGYRIARADADRHRRAVAAAQKASPSGRVTLAGYLEAAEAVSGPTGGAELRSGFPVPAGYTVAPRDEARHVLATMLSADGETTYLAAASEIDEAMGFSAAIKALEERIVARVQAAARADARALMRTAREKAEAGDYAGAIEAMEAAWTMDLTARSDFRKLSGRLRKGGLKGLGAAGGAG